MNMCSERLWYRAGSGETIWNKLSLGWRSIPLQINSAQTAKPQIAQPAHVTPTRAGVLNKRQSSSGSENQIAFDSRLDWDRQRNKKGSSCYFFNATSRCRAAFNAAAPDSVAKRAAGVSARACSMTKSWMVPRQRTAVTCTPASARL